MTAGASPRLPRLDGLSGRVLTGLLQLGFVRYHRVQRGFAEAPAEYAAFLREVVSPRLEAVSGRLGIFGAGVHTEVVLKALPALVPRVHCLTDNDASLWHRPRLGLPVLPPADAASQCEAFFLSTAVFQRVLGADLRRLGFTGPILAVDDIVPPGWFLGIEREAA